MLVTLDKSSGSNKTTTSKIVDPSWVWVLKVVSALELGIICPMNSTKTCKTTCNKNDILVSFWVLFYINCYISLCSCHNWSADHLNWAQYPSASTIPPQTFILSSRKQQMKWKRNFQHSESLIYLRKSDLFWNLWKDRL